VHVFREIVHFIEQVVAAILAAQFSLPQKKGAA
jgi:hypothetical protein